MDIGSVHCPQIIHVEAVREGVLCQCKKWFAGFMRITEKCDEEATSVSVPEVNAAGQSTILRGIDFGTVPIPRTFSAGIRAKF